MGTGFGELVLFFASFYLVTGLPFSTWSVSSLPQTPPLFSPSHPLPLILWVPRRTQRGGMRWWRGEEVRDREEEEVQGSPDSNKKERKKKLSQPYPFPPSPSPSKRGAHNATTQEEEDVGYTVIEPLRLGGKVQSCQTFKVSLGKGGKRRGERSRRRRRVGERRRWRSCSPCCLKTPSPLPFPLSLPFFFPPFLWGQRRVCTHAQAKKRAEGKRQRERDGEKRRGEEESEKETHKQQEKREGCKRQGEKGCWILRLSLLPVLDSFFFFLCRDCLWV